MSPSKPGEPLIKLVDLRKTYHLGEIDVPVLKGVSLTIDRGEMVALMGASGSGKSTLMNILGCLDRPTSGEYWLDGEEVSQLSADERAMVRNKKIGFVFQSFNLLRPHQRPGQRDDAADLHGGEPVRRRGPQARPKRCWSASAWATAWTTTRRSCPAASSSAWPSPAR